MSDFHRQLIRSSSISAWTASLLLAACSGDKAGFVKQHGGDPAQYTVRTKDEVRAKSPCFDLVRSHFLEMQKKDLAPGVHPHDRLSFLFALTRLHPAFYDQNPLPYVPLTVTREGDDTIFQYIFVRDLKSGDWSLSSAWKITPDGALIEL